MISEPVTFNNINSSYILQPSNETKFLFDIATNSSDLNVNKFTFNKVQNKIFKGNLMLVESRLPELLSYIIITSHLKKCYSLKALTHYLVRSNPLHLNRQFSKIYYEQKIKNFLDHLVRGMNATEVWHDNADIYNCYPVMKVNDELLFYGNNIKLFREELFERSEISTISRITNQMHLKQVEITFGVKLS